MLRDAGISGPLASRVANAEVRVLTAVFDFFETLDELHALENLTLQEQFG
jgi:hypothetical protein